MFLKGNSRSPGTHLSSSGSSLKAENESAEPFLFEGPEGLDLPGKGGNINDLKASLQQNPVVFSFRPVGKRHSCRTNSTRRRRGTAKYGQPIAYNPWYGNNGTGYKSREPARNGRSGIRQKRPSKAALPRYNWDSWHSKSRPAMTSNSLGRR